MKLTDHFDLSEFTHSETAVRLGIDNTPSEEVIKRLEVLAKGMERIRAVLGVPIKISSGYRCEELEKVLCAKDFAGWCRRHGKDQKKPDSWNEYFARKAHPKGYACDFTAPRFGTPAQIVKVLCNAGIKCDQIIEEGTWAHVSFDPKMRGQVMSATFNNGEPTYSMGVPA